MNHAHHVNKLKNNESLFPHIRCSHRQLLIRQLLRDTTLTVRGAPKSNHLENLVWCAQEDCLPTHTTRTQVPTNDVQRRIAVSYYGQTVYTREYTTPDTPTHGHTLGRTHGHTDARTERRRDAARRFPRRTVRARSRPRLASVGRSSRTRTLYVVDPSIRRSVDPSNARCRRSRR